MELKDKSFKNNKTGEVVRVLDSYQNISVMNNNERVDTSRLLDPLYYTEQSGNVKHYTEKLDPNTFMSDNSRYSGFVNDIKGVDTTNLPGDSSEHTEGNQVNMSSDPNYRPSTNDSAVVQYDEEYEKQLLVEKYGASVDNDDVDRQNKAFDKILNPEVYSGVEQTNKTRETDRSNNTQSSSNTNRSGYTQPDYVESRPEPVVKSDPIIDMFKNVKRKEKFIMSLNIEDKIPRIDFIEMMEDSYETSLVEYLADDILNKVLKDPNILREKIIGEIEKLVYPNGKPVEEVVVEEVVETKSTVIETEYSNEVVDEVDSETITKSESVVEVLESDENEFDVCEEFDPELVSQETIDNKNSLVDDKKPPEPPKDRIIVEGKNPPKPKSVK